MSARSSRTTKPPPLKARLREAACDAILDAVEDVAVERGVDSTTIAAIAERAGVAVGTLYNYFPDRDAMFVALFRARRSEMVPRIVAIATDVAVLPFEDRLRCYLRGVFEVFEARRRFVRLALVLDQQGRRFVDREPTVLVLFTQHVEAILQDAVAHGRLAAARVGGLARYLVGAMKAYNAWVLEGDRRPEADFVVDTFLHGALAAGASR